MPRHPHTPEARARLRAAHLGEPLNPAHAAAIRAANNAKRARGEGYRPTPEHMEAMWAANRTRHPHAAECRAAEAAAMAERKAAREAARQQREADQQAGRQACAAASERRRQKAAEIAAVTAP